MATIALCGLLPNLTFPCLPEPEPESINTSINRFSLMLETINNINRHINDTNIIIDNDGFSESDLNEAIRRSLE